jgi:hypothetical protein
MMLIRMRPLNKKTKFLRVPRIFDGLMDRLLKKMSLCCKYEKILILTFIAKSTRRCRIQMLLEVQPPKK